MWLINTKSLELKEFMGEPTDLSFPRYAILSHTWGEKEVSFQDMQDRGVAKKTKKTSFGKISNCCRIALNEGLSWVWVDTCCIDKTSSAELSEAINSMFKWYEAATICYAYLEDAASDSHWTKSRWFTRGWTLQELVAPFEVVMFDWNWSQLGTKRRLTKELEQVTRIPEDVLLNPETRRKHSVAARMSWAQGRRTTRVEDRAYSLLGLFDISMPLLYGEGDKAFSRLQQEILNGIQDDTMFLGELHYSDQDLSKWPNIPGNKVPGKGILITPDNMLTGLPTMVHPLPGTAVPVHDMTGLMPRLSPVGDTAGGWERNDPRLRGNILSMPMRIIQVILSRQGPAPVPITMKKQIEIELGPGSKTALEHGDFTGVRVEGGSLCLAMLRCSTPEGRLVARYFMCLSANNELWAYPMSVYRLVSPKEVYHWPYMQCHILLDKDVMKPRPVLRHLRDAASWSLTNQLHGNPGYGWTWTLKSGGKSAARGSGTGFVRLKAYSYMLIFQPTAAQLWYLTISLGAERVLSNGWVGTVAVEIELECSTASGATNAQTVKVYHRGRGGPVTELWRRMPVLGGSAELVVMIYYGVDGASHCYSPMIRFRAFEASDDTLSLGQGTFNKSKTV